MNCLKAAIAALALGATGLTATAQERPNTILVLDASGSMWGQIDGVNKITIARDVVADILTDFPEDQNLGFVTYGHRERGQCSDIQTVIQPAPGTAHEIIGIVNELNPRGMTPMTDAVIAAAQALRSTEQAATVILVSDGIETCNPDPCAAARALAEGGVDFTTHVIGFDVRGEAEALIQMQCLAEETGGRFLTADNAQELSDALAQVVAAPTTGTFTFTASLGGPEIAEPIWDQPQAPLTLPLVPGEVLWEITDNAFSFAQKGAGNPLTLDLPFGPYIVTVHSAEHDILTQTEAGFSADSGANLHVIFPPAVPQPVEVTMIAVTDNADGPQVETPVSWTFEIEGESFEIDGNPGAVELAPGHWNVTGYHAALEREQSAELTVVKGQPQTHVMVFELPLPVATVSAPAQVVVGSAIPVTWEGEGLKRRDYVTIVPAGAEAGTYTNYDRVDDGTEGSLRAPAEPGLYEVRLQMEGSGRVLATTPVEVVDAAVTVSAPEQVVVGSTIPVTWEAEGLHPRDYVTIVPTGADAGTYTNYDRLEGATEGSLRAPAEPGLYEVRLQMEGSGRVLATRPIEVVEGDVSIGGPDRVRAGTEMALTWSGAIYPRDYITIVPADSADDHSAAYIRVDNASEGRMTAPAEPGLYEIRYHLEQGDRVMARHPVEVLAADAPMDDGAGLVVPATGKPGETITVTWTGGTEGADQRVTIARADQAVFSWIGAESAVGRNNLEITLPQEPGSYEVRFLDVAGRAVLGRSIIEVAP